MGSGGFFIAFVFALLQYSESAKIVVGPRRDVGKLGVKKSDPTTPQASRRVSKALSWFVHMSDLHISVTHGEDGERRYRDLGLISEHVLPALEPAALVITGDVVEGKNHQGAGLQYAEEWAMYRDMLERFKRDTGLPEDAILDTRGNHDSFNVPLRGGSEDYYASHSAAGLAANNVSRRVAVASLPSKLSYDSAAGAWSRPATPAAAAASPAAVMLGVDFTPETGFRAIVNFAGVLTRTLEAQLKAGLQEALLRAHGTSRVSALRGADRLPVVAYGHYPLSTIHRAAGCDRAAPVSDRMVEGGVSAYLCGHLHHAFGHRQHRLHPSGGPGSGLGMVELETSAIKDQRRVRLVTVDDGRLGFVDLRMVRRCSRARGGAGAAAAAAAAGGGAGLASLEGSGVVPRNHTRECCVAMEGYGGGREVSGGSAAGGAPQVVVALTTPADARYGPTAGAPRADTRAELRVLVLPLSPGPCLPGAGEGGALVGDARTALLARTRVEVRWKCVDGSAAEPAAAAAAKSGAVELKHVGSGLPLFSAAWPASVSCDHPNQVLVLSAAATVGSAAGTGPSTHTSEWRPVDPPSDMKRLGGAVEEGAEREGEVGGLVAALAAAVPRHIQQPSEAAAFILLRALSKLHPAAAGPLVGCGAGRVRRLSCQLTLFENLVLKVDWTTFAVNFFWGGWTLALVGLLLLPRLLSSQPLFPSSPSAKPAPPSPLPPTPSASDASPEASGPRSGARRPSRHGTASPSPIRTGTGPSSSRVGSPEGDLGAPSRLASGARALGALLASLASFPVRTLVASSGLTSSLAIQAAYLAYFAYAPVFKAVFLTTSPPVWVSLRGFTYRTATGAWERYWAPDLVMFVFCTHVWFVVLPFTWALADFQANVLLAGTAEAMAAGRRRPKLSLATGLAAARATLAASVGLGFHVFLLRRAVAALGWRTAALSPGYGWTALWFSAALLAAHGECAARLRAYHGRTSSGSAALRRTPSNKGGSPLPGPSPSSSPGKASPSLGLASVLPSTGKRPAPSGQLADLMAVAAATPLPGSTGSAAAAQPSAARTAEGPAAAQAAETPQPARGALRRSGRAAAAAEGRARDVSVSPGRGGRRSRA